MGEVRFSHLSALFSRCGSPRESTTSQAPRSSTGSASESLPGLGLIPHCFLLSLLGQISDLSENIPIGIITCPVCMHCLQPQNIDAKQTYKTPKILSTFLCKE